MDAEQVSRYRARLTADLAALERDDDLGQAAQKTVTLDQQSVGRLSRMDALQGQAMAKATQARRAAQRQRIMAALVRLDDGEFGYCAACGDEIAANRLELDPTVPTCISCARG